MAALRNLVNRYNDEIQDGIAWVAIWKNGRSWEAEAFWCEDGSYEDGYEFSHEDMERMEEILKIDSKAVMLNGYYTNCGAPESGRVSIATIVSGVEWNYYNGYNRLIGFYDCYAIKQEPAPAAATASEPEEETEEEEKCAAMNIREKLRILTESERRNAQNITDSLKGRKGNTMKKSKQMHAVNLYEVTFNAPEFNAVYKFVRDESAAFDYGNKSAVTIYRNDKFQGIIDTRYDHEVMRDFDEWCLWYLGNMFDPAYEPAITKI